jgi:hypothetical protein
VTAVVEVDGRKAVAGLSWINYQSGTVKGIDAKERSFNFDAVAYHYGKGRDSKKEKILAGGYVLTEDQIANPDAPDVAALLKLPSLMLCVIARSQGEIGSENGVSGLFKIEIGDGRFWIGAVNNSVPLPFESSDALFFEDQLQVAIDDIREQACEIAGDIDLYELEASDFFDAKPPRSVGKVTKGRSTTLVTTAQLGLIVAMFGLTGWMLMQIFTDERPAPSSGPSEFQQRNQALASYRDSVVSDFGFVNAHEAYKVVLAVTEGVAAQTDNWKFDAVSCQAGKRICLFRYQSPGYGAPSTLESVIGTSLELNLSGQEALYRKEINMLAEVDSDFEVPLSESVRVELLDAAAFLRGPALGLEVELTAPEMVRIKNASFLSGGSSKNGYSKGTFSVSGPLGLMSVASEKLVIPGVVVTEVVINNDDFSLRGHYAFN